MKNDDDKLLNLKSRKTLFNIESSPRKGDQGLMS